MAAGEAWLNESEACAEELRATYQWNNNCIGGGNICIKALV